MRCFIDNLIRRSSQPPHANKAVTLTFSVRAREMARQAAPLLISITLNLLLAALLFIYGVPRVAFEMNDSMEVTLTDFFAPEEAPPFPSGGGAPGGRDVVYDIASMATPVSSRVSAPELTAAQTTDLDWQIPVVTAAAPVALTRIAAAVPRPTSTATPAPGRGVAGSTGDTGTSAAGGSGDGIGPGKGPAFSTREMIGGLNVIEKNLMVVTPTLRMGPMILVPESYKTSLRRRAGPSFLEMKIRSHGHALDEEFVDALISFAEKAKPDAIYWLHMTICDEYPPARQKLSDWILSEDIKLYVSSWDIPLSPELKKVVHQTGGEYEQRNTYNRLYHALRTTPAGSARIKERLAGADQASAIPHGEENLWEGYIIAMEGVREHTKEKVLQSKSIQLGVKGSSLIVHLPREEITRESWEELAELYYNRRKQGFTGHRNTTFIVSSNGEEGAYLVEKDPKTGQWSRAPAPDPDDLVKGGL